MQVRALLNMSVVVLRHVQVTYELLDREPVVSSSFIRIL